MDIAPFANAKEMIETGIQRNAAQLAVVIFLPDSELISDEIIKKHKPQYYEFREMCNLFDMELLDTVIIDKLHACYSARAKEMI